MKKDKIGIITSFLCLIHCIIFPLLFSVLPILKIIDERFEWTLIIIAFLIGGLSFYDNFKRHKYFIALAFFVLGFLSISFGKIKELEVLNILGLMFLILAHYLNYKFIKKKDGCHPHSCKH